MWVQRLCALAVFVISTVACGGKSVYTEGGGEAGGGSQCEDTQCGGECVDITSNPRHCGECFDRCNADERCVGGSCVRTQGCEPPTTRCGGECVDLRVSQDNCGACGNACGFGSFCSGGRCSAQCPSGQCGGVCVDFGSDPNNCGACGNVCGPGALCSAGQCVGVCDGAICNGECVDPSSNPLHCGGCNLQCLGSGLACIHGFCEIVCPPETLFCDGACVDWRFDPQNCGGCNIACSDGWSCVEGNCTPPVCPTGTFCNGACVDLTSDPNHCGGCFRPCGMGANCVNGSCVGPGTCGDRIVQPSEEADPPPGPLMITPLDARTCRYDLSRINQWYCNGSCGNWGGPDGCDQRDADAFCKLKMDNPRSTAISFSTTTAQPAPGVCCPPPTDAPGSRGCTPLGVLSTRGVNVAVSVHPSNLLGTHQAGTVITNLVCTDP